jgi:hypothetical protein
LAIQIREESTARARAGNELAAALRRELRGDVRAALTVANTPAERRDFMFERLMQWGMSMVAVAPPIAWLVFVVPGWL